jgi:PadR family transcriptional regulator, regulatory protein PadR
LPDSFHERAAQELKRGVLQVAVLALLRRRAYGYDLLRTLADMGFPAEEGTLYPVLRRLESEGLLQSQWDTTGTRPRKYYECTNTGKTALAALAAEWSRVDEALRRILAVTESVHVG